MKKERKYLFTGVLLFAAFALWTLLAVTVDVRPVGVNGSNIGFAALNCGFHALTGFNMTLNIITDWLGLVPFAVCLFFAGVGFVQLVKRKNIFKVDYDIILLGVYYLLVIGAYIFFEVFPLNYRPVLPDELPEASYPSSLTLLALSVIPSLLFQSRRRLTNSKAINIILIISLLYSVFMVVGRLVCGIHWLTDIIGSVLLGPGLFYIYAGTVLCIDKYVISRNKPDNY